MVATIPLISWSNLSEPLNMPRKLVIRTSERFKQKENDNYEVRTCLHKSLVDISNKMFMKFSHDNKIHRHKCTTDIQKESDETHAYVVHTQETPHTK